MARYPRFFFPGAIYHVYCRVARGEIVFDDGNEAIEFVETLRAVRDLDGWTILAWVLLGNHYHFGGEDGRCGALAIDGPSPGHYGP